MRHCSSYIGTPLEPKQKLSREFHTYTPSDEAYLPDFPYYQFCGETRYLITCTRLDTCYTGHILSRAMQSPCKIHKVATKRTLRYLNSTKDYGVMYFYEPHTPMSFYGYVGWR